jgi:serine/threonine protein kinase
MLDSKVDLDAHTWGSDSNIRLGSSGWMPPERMQNNHRITFRDDIFGFGCLLYCVRFPQHSLATSGLILEWLA